MLFWIIIGVVGYSWWRISNDGEEAAHCEKPWTTDDDDKEIIFAEYPRMRDRNS